MIIFNGVGANSGIAMGEPYFITKKQIEISSATTENTQAEWDKFVNAKKIANIALTALFERTKLEIGESEAMIIDVQKMMLDDGDFNDYVTDLIFEKKHTALFSIQEARKYFSEFFLSLPDPYMQARATDICDMCYRLTQNVLGNAIEIDLQKPSVVIAKDLTPSETLQMDKSKILAFVMEEGSVTSHTVILARTMAIPCIVQCDFDADKMDSEIIVDGETGFVYINADSDTRTHLLNKQKEQAEHKIFLQTMFGKPTVTKSGNKIEILANIGSPDDLEYALANDAEGIGLFRSEFLYLGRDSFPSEEEQFEAYRKVAEGMAKPVTIRTLDIGADKQVDYFNLGKEENPALGLRGIRICIERQEIFVTQLRAIYRASGFGDVSIMFPMITSVWEVKHCKKIASIVQKELKDEGHKLGEVKLGIMIETPSAVMLADELAKEVDFFSVGTNDLTQYTLAIDRQNNKLERFYSPKHPSVLKMLEMIAKAAKDNKITASICGELAADLSVTEFLLTAGFKKLSVSPSFVLKLRAKIREM
ncbi:MAG: phosphoenolpyruvate--protein phosphotransferase [Defluviitaleaceae bacterium]|nr:phosphoenolpyruvate--protein phosphotransferase [Defluviitaleaceae bacterium]